MTTKNRILTIIGVGAVLISAELLVIRSSKRAAAGLANAIVAAAPVAEDLFKGTLGSALLEHRPIEGVRAEKQAVSRHLPNEGSPGFQSLLDEYQKDPQKFHKYAQVFDTWANANKVAAAALKSKSSAIAESSLSAIGVIADEKLDVWKHPFCVIRGADRIVIISGGANAAGPMDCREIKMSKKQLSATVLSSTEQRADGSLIFTFPRETSRPYQSSNR